jgi:hypothetical protein
VVANDEIVSKRGAAQWVSATYGQPWATLIAGAAGWRHGQELDLVDDIQRFIWFVSGRLAGGTGC